MISRTTRPLVLIGSGERVGVHVAKLFATKRFSVLALVARSEEHLQRDKAAIEEAVSPSVGHLTIKTYAVDVVDTEAFERVLERIERELGVPEHVNYNAASVFPTNPLEVSDEDLVYAYKTNVIGLNTFTKWALRMFKILKTIEPSTRPSFLVASSLLPNDPIPVYFCLSIAKAAQKNMMLSLHRTFDQEVDFGMLIIPRLVLPDDAECNAPNVAVCAWQWYHSFAPGQRPLELHVWEGGEMKGETVRAVSIV